MLTFAWEVLEVYSGPAVVAFKWRHWDVMKNDYVGFNDQGEKVVFKAHGGTIDIQGITIAKVDDKVRLQSVETWFDPMEMFRQICPNGDVTKTVPVPKPGPGISSQLHGNEEDLHELEGIHLLCGGGTDVLAALHEEMDGMSPAGYPFLATGLGPRVLRRGEGW